MKTALVVLSLSLLLAACGGGSGESGSPVLPTATPTVAPATPTVTPTTAPTVAPEATATPSPEVAAQLAATKKAVAAYSGAVSAAPAPEAISRYDAIKTWTDATDGAQGFADVHYWFSEELEVEKQISEINTDRNDPNYYSSMIKLADNSCRMFRFSIYLSTFSKNDLADGGFSTVDNIAMKAFDEMCFMNVNWQTATADDFSELARIFRDATPIIVVPVDIHNSNFGRYNALKFPFGK